MRVGAGNFKPRALLLTALCCLQCLAGSGQWSSLGPQGGGATAFTVHPESSSIVLLGSSNGAFRSTDGGQSWQRSSQGLADPRVESLLRDPADPNRILAATQGGVFLSLDGGLSWQSSSQGLTDLFVEALAIDPANSEVLYAATHDGIFKSLQGGSEWFQSSQGIVLDRRVLNLAVSPSQNQTLYAVTLQFGVYKSVDGGNGPGFPPAR